MDVVVRIVAGTLLIAHGMVHLLYLVADVPEFTLEDSWIVPEEAARPVAVTLMGATIIASAMLGLAVWGVPGLAASWPFIAIAAGVTSLLLLLAFWDNHLVFGAAIDVALVIVALVRPDWTDWIGG